MKESQSQNFGLTNTEFEQMAKDLRQGDGRLFEKIFLAHFKDCTAYLENQCGASSTDAYDATMETLIQFRHLVIEGKIRYQNLRFLFTRMAAQWYWRWKKNTFSSDPVEGFEPQLPFEEFDEESMQLLDLAWAQLGEKCQSLLTNFFYHGQTLVELAKQLDQTDATLRQRKKRCVEQLRSIFFSLKT